MAAPVQTAETSAAASASTVAVAQTSAPTLGNVNVVWVRGPSGTTVSSVTDTQGNTYTSRGSVTEAGTGQMLFQFTAPITSSGANTVTATYGAAIINRAIYVLEGQGTYDAANTGTDAGNNPTTSVSATNSGQPATLYMLANDVQGGTPAAGSGFTDVGTGWGTVSLVCRVQYKTVTTTGSQSGNFVNPSWNRVNSGLVILLDSSPPVITVQPTEQTTADGSTASFSATVTGADSYQWETLAPGGGSWGNVSGGSGATTASYTTGTLTRASDSGRFYRLKATNARGDTYTSVVQVRVTSIPSSYDFGGFVIGAG